MGQIIVLPSKNAASITNIKPRVLADKLDEVIVLQTQTARALREHTTRLNESEERFLGLESGLQKDRLLAEVAATRIDLIIQKIQIEVLIHEALTLRARLLRDIDAAKSLRDAAQISR